MKSGRRALGLMMLCDCSVEQMQQTRFLYGLTTPDWGPITPASPHTPSCTPPTASRPRPAWRCRRDARMPPTARWPSSCPVLRLRPPGRAAGSRGGTQRAQQVVDGAQLHSLHGRRRAFLVRDLGAEAGLVDDDAAEFVLDDDGVAVRPFRLQQRHFGGCIHRFPILFLPLGHFAFEMRAANSDGGDSDGDPHVLPLVARNEPAHVSKRTLEDPGGEGLLAGTACRLEIPLHFEFR